VEQKVIFLHLTSEASVQKELLVNFNTNCLFTRRINEMRELFTE
jgi:hypothetical protein